VSGFAQAAALGGQISPRHGQSSLVGRLTRREGSAVRVETALAAAARQIFLQRRATK